MHFLQGCTPHSFVDGGGDGGGGVNAPCMHYSPIMDPPISTQIVPNTYKNQGPRVGQEWVNCWWLENDARPCGYGLGNGQGNTHISIHTEKNTVLLLLSHNFEGKLV